MEGLRVKLGKRIMAGLKINSEGVKYAAIDMMGALMKPNHDFYDPFQEQLNKKSLLTSKVFVQKYDEEPKVKDANDGLCRSLASLLGAHARLGTGALVTLGLLDFFTFALCEPYSTTTEAAQFDMTLVRVFSSFGP